MLQKHLAEAEVERLRLVEALERAEQRATDAEHAERVAAHAEADAERRALELTKERDEALALARDLRWALEGCIGSLQWADKSWTRPAAGRGSGLPMMRAALQRALVALDAAKERGL
jgi:hypothetical protein